MKLRHDDTIQLDRFCTWVRHRLDGLVIENKQLQDIIQQLRNKPDAVYDPPDKKNFKINVGRERIDLSAPINNWKTNHFIRYFQQEFKKKYGEDYKVQGKEWQANAFRVKQFKDTHEEIHSNAKYRNFIDWVFANIANRKFVPSIVTISSDLFLTKWNISGPNGISARDSNFSDIIDSIPKTTLSTEEIMKGAF